jgi:hypothetical protein
MGGGADVKGLACEGHDAEVMVEGDVDCAAHSASHQQTQTQALRQGGGGGAVSRSGWGVTRRNCIFGNGV